MQYLVILLDDTSVSYCHCDNPYTERRLIGLDALSAGICYAMKENLMIQFVYPDYELPKEYLEAIDSIDHHDIVPWPQRGDVVVIESSKLNIENMSDRVVMLRMKKDALFESGDGVASLLRQAGRINVVITNVESFTDEEVERYSLLLDEWAVVLREEWGKGRRPQLNLLTDRIMLKEPNHCDAGVENITLAPNGRFYLCPAFYYSDAADSVDPQSIKNPQLLCLDHAPLCRRCDAWHCRRCVWLNRKSTHEMNTPSHEQCIVAHTERNAARRLLASLREEGEFFPGVEITEINYLDPFEVMQK